MAPDRFARRGTLLSNWLVKRARRILFNTLTATSLLLMVCLFLLPEQMTIGRWFIYSQFNWIEIQKYSRPSLSLSVPFWWPLLATLVLPVACVVRRWVIMWMDRISHKPDHCPVCGYDMRANPKRCSECGMAVANGDSIEG